jgi:hypothetical protein
VHQEWAPEGDGPCIPETLRREFPGAEVLNLAAGAQNSAKVRAITSQAVLFEPDLIVIATCNNEGVLPRSEVDLRLRQSAGYRMLQHIVTGPYEGARPQHTPQDPDVDAVREAFRDNIRAMISDAERANVPVVLATLPVNLRYADTDSGHVIQGYTAPHRDRPPPNHDANPYRRTPPEAVDDLLAELSYDSIEDLRAAGLLLYQAERYEEARAALEQYTELMPRNRCRPSFNDVIREEAARAPNVTLVDLDLWARSVAPHGLPGDDLFVDYCHMNEEGYWLAGAEVSRVIQESGILSH